MNNLIHDPAYAAVQTQLEQRLQKRMQERGDSFRKDRFYLEQGGLTHYGEVHTPCQQVWQDPWESTGMHRNEGRSA